MHIFRTKREISVVETPQSAGDVSYAKKINLKHEKQNDNDYEDGTYQDDAKEKLQALRKGRNSTILADFHPSNAEESFDRDTPNYFNSQHSNERLGETEEASNLVRLPRNINNDLDRYTDQNEGSSLYDDYEAKDVAKRGILNGEDYEEMEDDSPEISEDMAAVQGSTNEVDKREIPKDARVKRDQAEISEMLDKSKSNPDDSAKLEESKTAPQNSYSRDVSRVELSKSFNDASKFKDFGAKNIISKSNGFSKIQEPASIVAASKRDESNAEYEKRVEEEIQRKIDSIKEDIRRDIEAQQRIRDIEDNNAKFDELQDEEHEDEDRQNFEDEPIEKRQTIAKRSIREIVDDAVASSKKDEEKRSSRKQYKKRQHRSQMSDRSETLKENKNLKRRSATNQEKSFEQIPAKEHLKKKRERVRQIFLMNNDQHQTKKRQLRRRYASSTDRIAIGSKSELFMNPDSHLLTDNRMVKQL